MKAECPRCQALIPAENLSVQNDVAVCQQCAEMVSLSSLIAGADPIGNEIPSSFRISRVPSGAWYNDTPTGFRVGATTRCIPLLLFLVPFTVVWAGGSMGGIYGTQIVQGKFIPLLCLFGLPFVAGSVMLLGVTLMTLAGKIVVEVDSGQGRVFTGVAGIGWSQSFQWDEIDAVKLERTYSNRRRVQYSIALEGATRVRFGSQLSDARRFYILNALRTLKANGR